MTPMALPKLKLADHSDTYLRDVIAEVLANNSVYPTDKLVHELLVMVVQLRAEARTDKDVISEYIRETLKELKMI